MDSEELFIEARREERRADPGSYLASTGHPLCRHAEVSRAFRDPAYLPAASGLDSPLGAMYDRWLISLHGERHQRVRRRLTGLFGPRRMDGFRPGVEARVGELLDEVQDRGECDFVTALARPLPFTVVCDVLGVPQERRAELLDEHAAMHMAFALRDEESWARADIAAERMQDLFRELIEGPPGSGTDLLSAFQAEIPTEPEAYRDLIANCVLLLDAGHATTTTLIAGGLSLLLDRPETLARVRDDEWAMDAVVEELVRLLTPIGIVNRVDPTTGDAEVYFTIGANQDPEVFDRPAEIDPTRLPNLHLAFGAGRHACLGAPLARLQAVEALSATLARLPELRRNGRPEWRASLPLHEMEHLPIAWDA